MHCTPPASGTQPSIRRNVPGNGTALMGAEASPVPILFRAATLTLYSSPFSDRQTQEAMMSSCSAFFGLTEFSDLQAHSVAAIADLELWLRTEVLGSLGVVVPEPVLEDV